MKLTKEEENIILNLRIKKGEIQSEFQPRLCDNYTTAEKIIKFDELHQFALDYFNGVIESGYQDDDFEHYCSEEILKLLSHQADGTDIFKTLNNY